MAFDGITIHALSDELAKRLVGKKIAKIAQPEGYELLITLKGDGETLLLFASADASLPLLYLTEEKKKSPESAPSFCMVMRKHLQGGRITAVTQEGFERVIRISAEHLDEMGDLTEKQLYVEIMGKHSNIILTDKDDNIIDSIKRVNSFVSSVREVLPGKPYFIPSQEGRISPLDADENTFHEKVFSGNTSVSKALLSAFTGFGSSVSEEICFSAGIDSDSSTAALSSDDKERLFSSFSALIKTVSERDFHPAIYYERDAGEKPFDYSVLSFSHLSDLKAVPYESVSQLLCAFYSARNLKENIKQKSEDLRRVVRTLLQRNRKTLSIQEKQLQDTEKMDRYRLWGELLHTYGHSAEEGAKSITVDNYYTNEKLTIPLDPTLSAMKNAEKYFKTYDKLKRTKESVTERIRLTKEEIDHLSSIETSLTFAETPGDLSEIRRELFEAGFIRKASPKGKKTKTPEKAPPLHFITKNGFHVYVGKNNFQNEEVTFKIGTAKDWWFHTKTIHGSHVIIKTEGKELPDQDFVTAAEVAAYFSTGRESDKVEVDYVLKKEVKKTPGTAPGFVIYYTNYSMVVRPSLDNVTKA